MLKGDSDSDCVKVVLLVTLNLCGIVIAQFDNYYNWPDTSPPVVKTETRVTGKEVRLRCNIKDRFRHIQNGLNLTWEHKTCRAGHVGACMDGGAWHSLCGTPLQPCPPILTLVEPQIMDSGLYRCFITLDTSTITLNVYMLQFVEKRREPPVIVDGMNNNLTVVAQMVAVLQCKVHSLVPPTVRWFRRLEPPPTSSRLPYNCVYVKEKRREPPVIVDGMNNNLTVVAQMVAVLQCKVHSLVPPTVRWFRRLEPPPTSSRLPYNCVYVKEKRREPPVIVDGMNNNLTVVAQMVAVLQCKVHSLVPPTVRWFRRLKPPPTSSRLPYNCVYVKEKRREPPVIVDGMNNNLTVVAQMVAVLQCKVHSLVPPTVRWFRRLEPPPTSSRLPTHNFIQYLNNTYKLLNCCPVAALSQRDIYLSKLVISVSSIYDSGFYICLTINDVNYTYKEAYINVLPLNRVSRHKVETGSFLGLFLIPAALAMIPAVAWIMCLRPRKLASLDPPAQTCRQSAHKHSEPVPIHRIPLLPTGHHTPPVNPLIRPL